MPQLTYYSQGDWNGCCDQCGRGFKFSQLSKRWDGAWACSECWEPRHPQDFVRGVKDDSSVPVGRPRLNLPTAAGWSNDVAAVLPWSSTIGLIVEWG